MTALPTHLPPLTAPRSGNAVEPTTAATGERPAPQQGRKTEAKFDSLLDRSGPTDRPNRHRHDHRPENGKTDGDEGAATAAQNSSVAVDRRVAVDAARGADGEQGAASGTGRGLSTTGTKLNSEAETQRDTRPVANGSAGAAEVGSPAGTATPGASGAGAAEATGGTTPTATDTHNSADAKPTDTYTPSSLTSSNATPLPTTTPDLSATDAAAIGAGSSAHPVPAMDVWPTAPASIANSLPTVPASTANTTTVSGEPAAGIRTQILQQVLRRGVGEAGASRMTVQLEPEHLGRVTVELRSDGSRLTIVFDAESAVTQAALREGGKELAGSLLERGGGRWSQVEVKLAEQKSDERQPEPDERREDTRQQREQGGTDGRNGRSNRRRSGG